MGSLRDNLKNIMRTELPFTFGRGAVESIIGLTDYNYNQNNLNEAKIINLENNETIFQVFTYVGTSPSGQITIPEQAKIFDIYADNLVDSIAVKADENQKPLEEFVTSATGEKIVVISLIDNGDGTAGYALSDTPTQTTCLLYFLKIKDKYKQNIPEGQIIPPIFISNNNIQYAGPTTLPTFIDNGNGSATFNSLIVNLFPDPDGKGVLKQFVLAEQTFSFADNSENYIVADYNSGTPIMRVETDKTLITHCDIFLLMFVWRQGSLLHSIDLDEYGVALSNKIFRSIINTVPYRRSIDGGLILSESQSPADRTILVTDSKVYAGIIPVDVLTYNSSVDSLILVSQVNGVWTYSSNQNQYNNTQYNPLSGLETIPSNKYANRYFYRSIGDIKETFYILGEGSYVSVLLAQEETVPNPPLLLRNHCILVGRITILVGATVGIVESSFSTEFTTSPIISHNDTLAIQGGVAPHYYHSDQPINKINVVTFGGMILPKTKGRGIQLDVTTPSYAWADLIGYVTPKSSASAAPTLDIFRGSTRGFRYTAGDNGDIIFHIPHDYLPGSPLYIHPHWGHNGTDITGSLGITYYFSYANRTLNEPATTFGVDKVLSQTISGLTIANSPQYCHRVDEVLISTVGGSASTLDTDLIAVDGIINLHYDVTTIPTITAGSGEPFIFTLDIHYQTTGLIGTKSKDPDYYI